jgi:hypothetical protein
VQEVEPDDIEKVSGEKKGKGENHFLVVWTNEWVKESELNCPGLLKEFLNSSPAITFHLTF